MMMRMTMMMLRLGTVKSTHSIIILLVTMMKTKMTMTLRTEWKFNRIKIAKSCFHQ